MKYDSHRFDRHRFSFTPEDLEKIMGDFQKVKEDLRQVEESLEKASQVFSDALSEDKEAQDALDE